jgi:hypothetical protein
VLDRELFNYVNRQNSLIYFYCKIQDLLKCLLVCSEERGVLGVIFFVNFPICFMVREGGRVGVRGWQDISKGNKKFL